MNSNLQQLLYSISKIKHDFLLQREEKTKRGEMFDVFKEMDFFTRHEEQLHTPFIAMLLNKDASHGLEDKFLKAFINDIVKVFKPNFEFNTKNSQLHSPFNIGPKYIDDKGNSTGGEIDLFVGDNYNNANYNDAIIIENKFNRYGHSAEDQERQLERYYNYGKDHCKQFIVIYLTPEGHKASSNSTGHITDDDYYCLSYDLKESHPSLLGWLNHCVEIASRYPLIRETIIQYINYLNLKRFAMEEKEKSELIHTILKTENIDSALSIISLQDDIFNEARERFINNIADLAKSYGLESKVDEGLKYYYGRNQFIHMFYPGSKNFEFRIGFESPTKGENGGALYGIYGNDEDLNSSVEHTTKVLNPDEYDDKHYPFGWAFFWSGNGIKYSGEWWNWKDINTIADMSNGSYLEYIKKVFNDMKGKGLLEKLKD